MHRSRVSHVFNTLPAQHIEPLLSVLHKWGIEGGAWWVKFPPADTDADHAKQLE